MATLRDLLGRIDRLDGEHTIYPLPSAGLKSTTARATTGARTLRRSRNLNPMTAASICPTA
jgi:hypothetical protein